MIRVHLGEEYVSQMMIRLILPLCLTLFAIGCGTEEQEDVASPDASTPIVDAFNDSTIDDAETLNPRAKLEAITTTNETRIPGLTSDVLWCGLRRIFPIYTLRTV